MATSTNSFRKLAAVLGVASGLAVSLATGAQEIRTPEDRSAETQVSPIETLAPQLVRLVNLAAADPVLASSLVPEAWIGDFVRGVLALSKESATPQPRIGRYRPPSRELLDGLRALDAHAVAALYRAAEPRVLERASVEGASPAEFDTALNTARLRLLSTSVSMPAARDSELLLTPTQYELAKLGPGAVAVVQRRVRAIGVELGFDVTPHVAEGRP
ncbi:MAG: hypothetical protein HKP27_01230 [Myxococcales bacterium]|nr:hypothetical protein [Myxococcales bacterium]